MKLARTLTLFLTICSMTLMAQKNDEQVVAETVQQLNQAMIDANQTILDQLTADQLSYGHSSGLVEDKNAFIKAIVDGTFGFVSIDLTEQVITLSGDVALVRHRFYAKTDDKGREPGIANISVMQVWQKKKGKWRLVGRQAVKL